MLRASSAGLISAVLPASRRWQALYSTRPISISMSQGPPTYSPDSEPSRPAESSTMSSSRDGQETKLRVQCATGGDGDGEQARSSQSLVPARGPRLRVKNMRKPGLQAPQLTRGTVTSEGTSRSKRHVRERGPRLSLRRRIPSPGAIPREALVHPAPLAHSHSNRKKTTTRAPFILNYRIAHRIRTTLGDSVGSHVIDLLGTIASGQSVQEAWSAYVSLTHLQKYDDAVALHFPQIPNAVLARLARHISWSRPISKSHFPRLLHVMRHQWNEGNNLPIEAWNTLINFSGKGQRVGTRRDYEAAVSIFRDMIAGRCPGSNLPSKYLRRGLPDVERIHPSVQPDLYTFNTLLHIAARSLSKKSVQDAISLLQESALQPDYITHMCLLVYHTRTKSVHGVRSTLAKMVKQNLRLPIDALNAVIYAFAFNDRNDIVLDIYRVLRNNVAPEADGEPIELIRARLWSRDNLDIGPHVKPDEVTYTLVIQAAAHSGDFFHTFSTLHEFLAPHRRSRLSSAAAPAFRAAFLGFSKHACGPTPQAPGLPPVSESKWNLDNLSVIYRLFLGLPASAVPSRSVIYWIMVAFDKASGHDRMLMRSVWIELKERFEPRKPALFMQPRLRRLEASLFRD